MATINVSSSVQVTGGPQLSFSAPINVEAYEKVELMLKKGVETQTVSLGKGLSVLMIKSNLPNPSASKLIYKVGEKDVALDASHTYIGKGALSVLGASDADLVLNFTFTPADPDKDAVLVEILSGKDV